MRRWRGVLCIEGEQTGDGRLIAEGALEWSPLPLPLAWLQQEQHGDLLGGGVQVGTIDAITREGNQVLGTGTVDDEQPDGAELVRRLEAGTASHGNRQGLSIDPDNWQVEILLTDAEEGEDEGVLLLASAGRGQLPQARTAAAGDPDDTEGTVLLFADDSGSVIERYTRLRIRGATACNVPAFDGAYMELEPDTAGTEPADDPEPDAEPAPEATTAAAAPARATVNRPPAEAFHLPEPEPGATDDGSVYGMPVQELLVEQPDGGLAVPFTMVQRGGLWWAFGHAARWGQCHIGYPGQCVTAPESLAAYAHFHHGSVLCADGTQVATGPLTMGTDHADYELLAPEARDHYANTGLAFADVRATNGALGVWVSGVVRPTITEAQLQVIRASSLSGDWRRIGTNLEFIGALAVNVPGFPIARELLAAAGVQLPMAALAASAYTADGVQQSLVAAGVVQRCPECQRRAMAARAYGEQLLAAQTPPEVAEVLALVRKIELRTRHLTAAAAEHAMAALRVNGPVAAPQVPDRVRPPRR